MTPARSSWRRSSPRHGGLRSHVIGGDIVNSCRSATSSQRLGERKNCNVVAVQVQPRLDQVSAFQADFPNFLVLLRKLLDLDFASIKAGGIGTAPLEDAQACAQDKTSGLLQK